MKRKLTDKFNYINIGPHKYNGKSQTGKIYFNDKALVFRIYIYIYQESIRKNN